MRTFTTTLLSFLFFIPLSLADLGTAPVSYSCDEMYYSFYYDYEKVRELWDKFQSPSSSCNQQVINWLGNDEVSVRDQLAYAIHKKEVVLEKLKTLGIIQEDTSLEQLSDKEFVEILLKSKQGLPDLISIKELKEKIEKEKSIEGSFLFNNNSKSWKAPKVGQGAGSSNRFGYFRIDQIGAPMDLGQTLEMRCSDLYRGFGQCEQDCVYLRTLLVDMHSKIKLFQKDWDWENDKMICTTQSAPKEYIIPFDASYCKESCPSSEVPCNTCHFKVSGEKSSKAITCLSEADARHAANLYCYLRGESEGCQQLSCNTIYNQEENEPLVVSAMNQYAKDETFNYSIGGEVNVSASAGIAKAGLESGVDLQAIIKSGFLLYTHEGPTTIKRYFSKRKDGKLFECSHQMFLDKRRRISCSEIDALTSYPGAKTSCDKLESDLGPCEEYKMGDGRAFYNCTAEFTSASIVNSKAFAGVNAELKIPFVTGGELEIYGNSKFGWEITESIMAESKKFNAGGITLEHMLSTCKRWTDQWLEISFENAQDKPWEVNLMPQTWFKSNTYDLEEDGYKMSCHVRNSDGNFERKEINGITIKLGHETIDKEIKGTNQTNVQKKKKVLQVAFRFNQPDEWWDFGLVDLSEFMGENVSYPMTNSPGRKEFFNVDFKHKHSNIVSTLHQGKPSLEMLNTLMKEMGEFKNRNFEAKNCFIIDKNRKKRRR